MEDDDDNNLFGEFTVYVIVALLLLILPLILLAVAKLLYVEPSQASVSGNDVKYPESADEQKMAECINKYIANYPASPYNKITNIGKYFVDAGKQYNIHPGYIVAMSQHESTLCANSAAKGCLCYNGWGRKAGTSQPECQGYGWYAYTGWEDGVNGHTKFVKEEYYERRGLKTVQQITPVYCPADDGCDVEGYTNLMISESEKAACTPLSSSAGSLSGPAAQKAVELAKSQLGKPYIFGFDVTPYQNHPPDNPPTSFDCSKLSGWAYYWATDGKLNMPAYTLDQVSYCDPIPAGQEQTGDLVFFETCSSSDSGSNHHVGIITEPGQYIHAPHTGDVVKISPLSSRTSGYCVCRIKQEYLQ